MYIFLLKAHKTVISASFLVLLVPYIFCIWILSVIIVDSRREAAKKISLIMARPLRPYPAHSLSTTNMADVSKFFLNCPVFTPPPWYCRKHRCWWVRADLPFPFPFPNYYYPLLIAAFLIGYSILSIHICFTLLFYFKYLIVWKTIQAFIDHVWLRLTNQAILYRVCTAYCIQLSTEHGTKNWTQNDGHPVHTVC